MGQRFNQKDQRILKLYNKNIKKEEICRKIGYGGNVQAGLERINDALKRAGVIPEK